jgi:hypothetical protein
MECQEQQQRRLREKWGRTGYFPDRAPKESACEGNKREGIRPWGPDRHRIWSYPGEELERRVDQEESKRIWNRF